MLRISRGTFPGTRLDQVRAQLDASRETASSLRELRGCVHFWIAVDSPSSTLVTVSVWEHVRDVGELDNLAPIVALTNELVASGVVFDKVITTFDVLGTSAPTRDRLGDPHDPLICRSSD